MHLKLVRYTTFTHESDLYRSSHVLLRVQLLVYALSATIHQNCSRAWTPWLHVSPWHVCHGDTHVAVDSGSAGLSGHAWIQPARQLKRVTSQHDQGGNQEMDNVTRLYAKPPKPEHGYVYTKYLVLCEADKKPMAPFNTDALR